MRGVLSDGLKIVNRILVLVDGFMKAYESFCRIRTFRQAHRSTIELTLDFIGSQALERTVGKCEGRPLKAIGHKIFNRRAAYLILFQRSFLSGNCTIGKLLHVV